MTATATPALTVSAAALDVAARAFGWTVALPELVSGNEHKHVFTRGTESVTVYEDLDDRRIVSFTWVGDQFNWTAVGEDQAAVYALVQLSQPA
ncbi:hypothetical protein SEA_DIRTMONSTER_56 [Mycobacterium phage DirtMonster]